MAYCGGGIQSLQEMGMLEWTCHVKPNLPHVGNPENEPFTNTLRNRFMRVSTDIPEEPCHCSSLYARTYSGDHGYSVGKFKGNGFNWIMECQESSGST